MGNSANSGPQKTMARIPGVPDLSRFVTRTQKVPVHNTVHFLVGVEVFELSGCVLSQKSEVLQGLVGCNREIYLDQFEGEEDGIQDVIELLYGGAVEITEANVKTILKFGVIYEVKDLYDLAHAWLVENIAVANLSGFIQFGMVIERLPNGHTGVLDICTNFIIDHGKEDLRMMSENWPLRNNTNIIKFMIQQQLLEYTLPILTDWINNDNDVNFIISELESKGLDATLSDYGDDSTALLDKMIEKVDVDLDTCKKVMKLQKRIKIEKAKTRSLPKEPSTSSSSAPEPIPSSSNRGLKALLSEDYRSFPLDKILSLEQDYQLEHFEFVEVAVECLLSNRVLASDFGRWWRNIRQFELESHYFLLVGERIKIDLPSVGHIYQNIYGMGNNQYKYVTFFCSITLGKNLNLANTFQVNCPKCEYNFRVIFKLVNKTPCYEVETADATHQVDHVYIKWSWLTCEPPMFHPRYIHVHYSLLTNDYVTVMEKIQSHDDKMGLHFLIRCDQ